MKEILITNDDGFDAAGILALKEALSPLGRVCVVAPAREKSACGHGLTITKPLSLISVGKDAYKLDDGTPADCIYLACNTLYKEYNRKPDLIVSGINIGCNMGEDVTYSGTVAGAMEGAILGVPSIAISQLLKKECDRECDFSLAKKVAFDLAQKLLTHNPLPKRKLLNVNIPIATESKGYKITELGVRLYGNDVVKARNPRDEEYYWLGTHQLEWEERSERASDFNAVMSGYVSITPITLDMTSYDDIHALTQWIHY
ncbi:5'/3'-nucleotidase SurE [Helicobacter sp.]|uniref:5'/3'-nucleotidase SurE n=1 Tax=Helicobacter sp. TaxID=218 RepID=UPI0025B98DF7|nr:5'/3'-nucleotidase SurE [Helicobacter sp.]MBR2495247.1 5'/3'-nucleotidase SurE [Helicobacter sp.]